MGTFKLLQKNATLRATIFDSVFSKIKNKHFKCFIAYFHYTARSGENDVKFQSVQPIFRQGISKNFRNSRCISPGLLFVI